MKMVCLSRKFRIILLCAIVLLAAACTHSQTVMTSTTEVPMVRLDPHQFPEFYDDLDLVGLKYTIDQTLRYLADLSADHPFVFGSDIFNRAHDAVAGSVWRLFGHAAHPPAAELFHWPQLSCVPLCGRQADRQDAFHGLFRARFKG